MTHCLCMYSNHVLFEDHLKTLTYIIVSACVFITCGCVAVSVNVCFSAFIGCRACAQVPQPGRNCDTHEYRNK